MIDELSIRPICMGLLWDILRKIFGGGVRGGTGTEEKEAAEQSLPKRRRPKVLTMQDLAVRLGMAEHQIKSVPIKYHSFVIPKASGKKRTIHAPDPELKRVQRLINKRVFGGVRLHDAAMAYVRGRSFVMHAARHADRAVVVRIDLKDFFGSIREHRVRALCRWLGWSDDAAEAITRLCTRGGSLPQGSPTSPRLANILSIPMDRRLSGLARANGAVYSRYADDLTFSFDVDDGEAIHRLLRGVKVIVWDCWNAEMHLHMKEKLHIRRAGCSRQQVTGLVVNDGPPRLPREARRRLRAIRHRLETQGTATITETQLEGWTALEAMIAKQGAVGPYPP